MVDLPGPAKVGNVHHPVNAFFHLNERTIRGEVADFPLDAQPDRIALINVVPWISIKLPHAKADLLLFLVDAQHDRFQFLTKRQHVGRTRNALRPAQLGHVHQSFDAVLDLHKRTVSHQLRNLPLDPLANWITRFDVLPRVVRHLLQAKAHTLLLAVHVQDLHQQTLTHCHHLRRMIDPAP